MRTYRLNALDIAGRILFNSEHSCRDDFDAFAEGERSSGQHPVEIWEGAHLVARVKVGNGPLTAKDPFSL